MLIRCPLSFHISSKLPQNLPSNRSEAPCPCLPAGRQGQGLVGHLPVKKLTLFFHSEHQCLGFLNLFFLMDEPSPVGFYLLSMRCDVLSNSLFRGGPNGRSLVQNSFWFLNVLHILLRHGNTDFHLAQGFL